MTQPVGKAKRAHHIETIGYMVGTARVRLCPPYIPARTFGATYVTDTPAYEPPKVWTWNKESGARLPTGGQERAECLSWLFWQMGSAPYLGGGFGHFYAYAPTKIEYAIDRFAMEVKRQLDVLDRRLADHEYLSGGDYSIADIAVWPWYGGLAKGLLYGGGGRLGG